MTNVFFRPANFNLPMRWGRDVGVEGEMVSNSKPRGGQLLIVHEKTLFGAVINDSAVGPLSSFDIPGVGFGM